MTRTRILPLVAAALTALFCLAALAAPSGAAASQAAKAPAKPKVGQCRNLTNAQSAALSDNSPTVPCSSPHTTYTFAVANAPKSVNMKHISSAKLGTVGLSVCLPRFHKTLGAPWTVGDQTLYQFTYFNPTKAQRNHGARWFRCDLVFVDSGHLDALPITHRPFIPSPMPDSIRRCITSANRYTPCVEGHAYRPFAAFTFKAKKYPKRAVFVKEGAAHCPSATNYSWAPKVLWNAGDHAEICYRSTTS
ncbi:MAG TPA: septum formation family protein [Marmoricola sp.]|jgi:hypothetical protein|nr:septum formation family protein [Marmoricola sp.]